MFHNILVPTDGSPAATYAVAEFARLAATAPGVQITLLTAIAPRTTEETDEAEGWLILENAQMRKTAEETLAATSAVFKACGILPKTRITEGSPASRVIAEEVARGHYDLVVMASRGLGTDRSERYYLGSVTENVLRKVPVPVLVIPIHPDR